MGTGAASNNRLQWTEMHKCQGMKVSAPPLNRDVRRIMMRSVVLVFAMLSVVAYAQDRPAKFERLNSSRQNRQLRHSCSPQEPPHSSHLFD